MVFINSSPSVDESDNTLLWLYQQNSHCLLSAALVSNFPSSDMGRNEPWLNESFYKTKICIFSSK